MAKTQGQLVSQFVFLVWDEYTEGKKNKKEHWREVENGDYVEKKKAHLMKFV